MNSRLLLLVSTLSALIACGCTHSIRVTEAEWEENTDKNASYWNKESGEKIFKGDYVFHLTDGSKLLPTRLSKTDTTFVIFEIYHGGNNVEVDDPIILPINEVESIEKITMWWGPTAVIMTIVGGVIGFFIWLGYSMSGNWT